MYRLMNVRLGTLVYEAATKEDMIAFIARYNIEPHNGVKKGAKPSKKWVCENNRVLSRIAMIDSDMVLTQEEALQRAITYLYFHESVGMYYRVYDSYNRVIDPRNWTFEVTQADPLPFEYPTRQSSVFRREPVPGLYRGRHRIPHIRRPRRLAEMRAAADPEHKLWVRPARASISLPRAWDDVWAGSQRSWKANSRKKRQWM